MGEMWYSMTQDEIEKKLNTNAYSGLSRKEAALRLRRNGENNIYLPISQPLWQHIKKPVSDIALIIFAVVLAISVFFAEASSSVALIFVSALGACASILMYLFARRRSEYFSERSVPQVNCIRDGKVFSVDMREIVVGDVIILRRGDIVPCDVRLIQSENLKTVEFTGIIDGHERKEVLTKDASVLINPAKKPQVSEQTNMIGAASVIAGGVGRAIAVRAGEDTFVGSMLGQIELVPSEKLELKSLSSLDKRFSFISIIMLVAFLSIEVLLLFLGTKELSIFEVLLSAFSLVVVSFGGFIMSAMRILPTTAAGKANSEDDRSVIKTPHSVGEMNYVDTVIVCGDKALSDDTLVPENIYTANRFYDVQSFKGGLSEQTDAFMTSVILSTEHNRVALSGKTGPQVNQAAAVFEFAEKNGFNPSGITEKHRTVEFVGSDVGAFDTTLVSVGDEYSIYCTSFDLSLLNLCTHIRTADGVTHLTQNIKNDIIYACASFTQKCKKVSLFASRISPTSSLSRLGAVQNQLVFDGYIVYSDPFFDGCADTVRQFSEADISVIYFGSETRNDMRTVLATRIATSKSEIAVASLFREKKYPLEYGLFKYKAYLGFSQKELEEIVRLLKGENGTVAVIGSDISHLGIMNISNVSVSFDDFWNTKKSRENLSGGAPILKKNSDVLIPHAKKSGGGLKSLYRAIVLSKNACTNTCKLLRYLMFSSTLRIFMSVIPMLFGSILMKPIHILLSGFIIDILAIIYYSGLRSCNGLQDELFDIEAVAGNPVGKCLKYALVGGVLALVLLFLSSVFGASILVDDRALSFFAFSTVAISQLFAMNVIGNPDESDKKSRILLFAYVLVLVIFLALCMLFPLVGEAFSVVYPGWQLLAAAPIAAVIGFVILTVTDRYI